MHTNFITPCPVYASGEHAGGAHACGPIDWGPAETGATFEVFVVQENGYSRGTGDFAPPTEMWELHTHPVEGALVPGPAIGFGLARVRMQSEHGVVVDTRCWCDRLTLVPEEGRDGGAGGTGGGGGGGGGGRPERPNAHDR